MAERGDLVGAILDDEARRALPRAERRRRVPPGVPVALALLALAIGWASMGGGGRTAPPSPLEQAEGARRHMVDARECVVAFVRANGRLPDNLEEVGLGDWGLEYEKTGPRQFELHMVVVGLRVTLRSTDDAGRFVRRGTNEPALIPALEAADAGRGGM